MQTTLITTLIFYILGTGFSFKITPEEQECARKNGLGEITFEQFALNTVCDFEDVKLPFRLFLRCSMVALGMMNEQGNLLPPRHDSIKHLKESVPVIEDKNEYAFQLAQKQFKRYFREVPPNCKGNLSKAWSKCAKDNGLPKLTTIETLRIIRGSTEPSQNFKQFLLCGLKDQEILTENGDINMESINDLQENYPLLKIANQTFQYKDKADFAYQLTKPIVQEYFPTDLLAQADNETYSNFEM